jgi:hypothetical protein
VFFYVPAEPHLSKRLLFSLTAKITRGARLEKNVVYVVKTTSEISNFVCPLCLHRHPRPPTYGMGRFPVTLYKEQSLKLLDMSAEIRAFIAANEAQLKKKIEAPRSV